MRDMIFRPKESFRPCRAPTSMSASSRRAQSLASSPGGFWPSPSSVAIHGCLGAFESAPERDCLAAVAGKPHHLHGGPVAGGGFERGEGGVGAAVVDGEDLGDELQFIHRGAQLGEQGGMFGASL
jgi:hypothetical protein